MRCATAVTRLNAAAPPQDLEARFSSVSAAAPLSIPKSPSERAVGNVDRTRALSTFAILPLSFEANQGQTDAQVKFLTRGAGYSLFLTADEAVFVLRGNGPESPATLRLKLGEANPSVEIEALDRQPGYVNYFIGNDPSHWRAKVSRFSKVRYKSVYPGIDVVYHGSQQQLEYDFVVAPGADPTAIQLGFRADSSDLSLQLTDDGDLLAKTAGKTLRQKKPVAYQEVDGIRRAVDVRYVLAPEAENGQPVTLAVGAYDRTQALVIDPVLVYSTFLGGSSREFGNGVAVDGMGFIYVTGETESIDFPGAINPPSGRNAFVAKLMPAGNGAADLIYATYLGGSTPILLGDFPSDFATGIDVDQSGNAFLTGTTRSSDFPTTPGAFQTQPTTTDCFNSFVARLDANGALSYSTYLGSRGCEQSGGIALDNSGNVIVTGTTSGSDFPTTAGALREAVPGQFNNDAFVSKLRLNAQGANDLVYSTLLGGVNGAGSAGRQRRQYLRGG